MSKIKKCAGKDGFQRMNYLFQVSNYFVTENEACNVAASLYSNLLINISKKTVQRIDVDIKRTICKGCRSLLLAGITCRVRIKKKNVVWTCIKCGTSKKFDTNNKDYLPWSQTKDSIVEIIDYNLDKNEFEKNEIKKK